MSLANETYMKAQGWKEFDIADNSKLDDRQLEFAHDVAKVFGSTEGKRVLSAMVQRYLVRTIAGDNDTNIAIGRKQGNAEVIHHILAQIELLANS